MSSRPERPPGPITNITTTVKDKIRFWLRKSDSTSSSNGSKDSRGLECILSWQRRPSRGALSLFIE